MTSKISDELWDIYTKDRSATGETHRRGNRMHAGQYHIVVHVCIFNHKNELLIQQRQTSKRCWPNMWDLSVCGSALAGESSGQAAARETAEELGLILDFTDKRPHFTINFAEGFDDYYILEQNIDLSCLTLQKDEVKSVRWAKKEEVLKLQEEGTMVPYWFLDRLFEIRGAYDAHGKNAAEIRIDYAAPCRLASCLSLLELLSERSAGRVTTENQNLRRDVMQKAILRKNALCALDKNTVVGILLFSPQENRLSCPIVHPGYRRQKIASQMINQVLKKLDPERDIVAQVFAVTEEAAANAFFRSLGFVSADICRPDTDGSEQCFILKASADRRV